MAGTLSGVVTILVHLAQGILPAEVLTHYLQTPSSTTYSPASARPPKHWPNQPAVGHLTLEVIPGELIALHDDHQGFHDCDEFAVADRYGVRNIQLWVWPERDAWGLSSFVEVQRRMHDHMLDTLHSSRRWTSPCKVAKRLSAPRMSCPADDPHPAAHRARITASSVCRGPSLRCLGSRSDGGASVAVMTHECNQVGR